METNQKTLLSALHEESPWWATDSGVRNRAGYIAHMRLPPHFQDQEARYLRECAERVMSKQLIAAAPDLLAALHPFVAHNSSEDTVTITVLTAHVKNARAAIAKATGSAA